MPSSSADADAPGGFAALGLTDVVVAAVAALGYEEPTPVQRQTIPLILAGGDLYPGALPEMWYAGSLVFVKPPGPVDANACDSARTRPEAVRTCYTCSNADTRRSSARTSATRAALGDVRCSCLPIS